LLTVEAIATGGVDGNDDGNLHARPGPTLTAGLQKNISSTYTRPVWEIKLHAEVEAWFLNLCRADPVSADLVAEAIDLLAEHGPALGRPLVDRVQASRFHNMKELRPGSRGTTEIRMLFAFDPHREAIFLIAGDKSGQWKKWYQAAIPIADDRFEQHLTDLKEDRP
jgi:hypothetical protein